MILIEGGNIWPESEPFDQAIAPELDQATDRLLQGTGLKVHVIGSAATPTPGKMSGDLDVMTDMDLVKKFFDIPKMKKLADEDKAARQALDDYLTSKDVKTYKAGVTVHILLPFQGKFHQVDIKVVRKAEKVAAFHRHKIPAGSPYKGVNKQMMMNSLASSQGLLWSPDEGLYKRDEQGKKADFLSDDLDEIAQYLLGKGANADSLGSVESILAAIPDEAKRNEIFDKARSSASWQAATPTVGTNEWFSRMKRMLS